MLVGLWNANAEWIFVYKLDRYDGGDVYRRVSAERVRVRRSRVCAGGMIFIPTSGEETVAKLRFLLYSVSVATRSQREQHSLRIRDAICFAKEISESTAVAQAP